MASQTRHDANRHPVKEAKTFQDKLKAFWEYYKIHTVVALIVVIFLGYGIYDVVSKPEEPTADFYVIAMTREELTDTQKSELEAGIKQSFAVKDGTNPTVEVLYNVYAEEDAEIKEESGGDEGYATTLQNAANSTTKIEKAEKTCVIYLYDEAYLEFLGDDESFVDLSSEYSGVNGIEGSSYYLKKSATFSDSSLPDDLQLRVKAESELDTTSEEYAWQMEAVDNIIQGKAGRTQEEVQQADTEYQQELDEYSNS